MNPSRRQANDAGRGGRDLAGLATSVRARFDSIEAGFVVEIEPLSTIEAFSLWPDVVPSQSTTVVIAVDDANDAGPPGLVADRFASRPCARIDDAAAEVPAAHLADLAVVTPADALVAVAIEGPVEPADAEAIRRATRRGDSALASEMRAVLAATAIGERALRVESRDPALVATFVGEALRRYVAEAMHRWPIDIGRPEPDLILRVLDRTGHLTVRPIETEVYPTSVDIGLGTHADGAARPAQTSLIYDVCSKTWHGDG